MTFFNKAVPENDPDFLHNVRSYKQAGNPDASKLPAV